MVMVLWLYIVAADYLRP